MLLFVVGIILGFGESREGRGGPPSSAQEETTVVGSVPLSPTHDGKDFDYWKPRMQRPFSDSERIEAIREVGGLIVLAMRRPDGRHWVADTVVPPMSQMLHDKSSEIRAAALGIFESYLGDGGKVAIPDLIQLLEDPDKKIRLAAIHALGGMGHAAEESIPVIVKVMRDDPSTAGRCVEAIQRMGPKGMGAYMAMLNDPNEEIRTTAVLLAGGTFHDEQRRLQLATKLMPLLRDPSPKVRAAAVSAVVPTADALPLMINLLRDKDTEVRSQAAFHVPPVREAAPAVIALLKDDDPNVREAAKIKLAKMAGVVKPLPREMISLADDPESYVRSTLARNLGRAGSDAVTALTKLLEDGNSVVRGAAAESLGEIGPAARAAAPALKARLADKGAAIRRAGDGKWLVCHAAAEALNQILGDKNYLAGLPPIPPDGK